MSEPLREILQSETARAEVSDADALLALVRFVRDRQRAAWVVDIDRVDAQIVASAHLWGMRRAPERASDA